MKHFLSQNQKIVNKQQKPLSLIQFQEKEKLLLLYVNKATR